MRGYVWLALTVPLLACLPGAITPAAAATLPARQPGLWQSSTIVTLADGSKYHNGAPVITVSCVDPASDLKFFTYSGTSCTKFDISGASPAFSITGTCQQNGKTVSFHTQLNYASPSTVNMTGNVTTPQGKVSLAATLTYQGECMAGMEPGDEGDVEGGLFVKSDNVNNARH